MLISNKDVYRGGMFRKIEERRKFYICIQQENKTKGRFREMMKKKILATGLILTVLAAFLVLIASVAMYSIADVEKGISEGGGKGGISLIPLPFIGVASADEVKGGAAFPDDEAGISTIHWGRSQDILDLNIEGILQPKEIEKISAVSQKSVMVHFSVQIGNCRLYATPAGKEWVYLDIDGLEPSTSPGAPQLPMKTFVVKLPLEAEVSGIYMISGSYRPIENELNIVPMPKPLPKSMNAEEIYKPNERTYTMDSYFPGKAVTYYVGRDNENTYVYVRIWPVQYNPGSKNAALITDADVAVYYNVPEKENFFRLVNYSIEENLGISSIDAECVIITPPELYAEAEYLKSFHELDESITTEVVNTTWIWDNYLEAEEPPYNGYNNSSNPGYDDINGYDYDLSLSIISFLRDTTNHSNLEYIVLFGNARLVPPSYYWFDEYYYDYPGEGEEPDAYNSWIPTDFFYTSPDYDFTPNYIVGRLPVNDSSEADALEWKIENWYCDADWSWFKNVALAGGKPFKGWEFIGDMQTSDIANKNYLNGMNITKLYLTEDNYNRSNVLSVHSGGYGLFYHSTHGTGYSFEGNNHNNSDLILATKDDIMALSTNTEVPIVISDTCDNGAFDTNIHPPPYYPGISISEAILLSEAGGIAYIGGSRVNMARPDYCFDDGRVIITREPQMAGMIDYVFKNYHEGDAVIGDITYHAMHNFTASNVFTDPSSYNTRTLFEFVLLGDSALIIPQQQSGVTYQKPNTTIENAYDDVPSNDGTIPVCGYEEVDLNITTDSPTVNIRVTDTGYTTHPDINFVDFDYVLDRTQKTTFHNYSEYSFTPDRLNRHLVRVESGDGKEGWQYVDIIAEEISIFDTGSGTYPSIMGIHEGTLTANQTITVHKMFTYPCIGTGGHTEYVKISNETGIVTEANWSGYKGDYHNLTFDPPFTLEAYTTYNYTIVTGSYPQIIHEKEFSAIEGGNITCTKFTDANGKIYNDWIPAIRLE